MSRIHPHESALSLILKEVALVCLILMLSGCAWVKSLVFEDYCASFEKTISDRQTAPPNKYWALKENPNRGEKLGAIIFVHGFLGHYSGTWGEFPQMLLDDPELKNFDVFLWGYPTALLNENPSLNLLGDQLITELNERLSKYRLVYLVGHSLGGLVIQTMIIDQLTANRASALSRIRHIFLYASPNQGIQLPRILELFNRTGFSLDVASPAVDSLRNEWIHRVYAPEIARGEESSKLRIPVTVVVGLQDRIVDERSARSFFRNPAPKTVQGDHCTMKEPTKGNDTAFLIVRNRISEDLRSLMPQQAGTEQSKRILFNALLAAQRANPYSCFTLDIGKQGSDVQVWSSAQALTGLLSTRDPMLMTEEYKERLRQAFSCILATREPHQGWARYPGSQISVVDVTAWVGLACLRSLELDGFWRDAAQTQNAKDTVTFVYQFLTRLQSQDGGWSHLYVTNPGPDVVTPYSSWVALQFLIQLRKSGLLAAHLKDNLDRAVNQGVRFVLRQFKQSDFHSERGWEGAPGEGLVCGLSILNLLLLEQAVGAGETFVSGHSSFRAARRDWIEDKTKCGSPTNLDSDDWLKQPARTLRPDGTVEYVHSGAGILRYPWSLVLLSHLLRDPELRSDKDTKLYDKVVLMWNRLIKEIPTYASSASSGGTYKAAETLYALNQL